MQSLDDVGEGEEGFLTPEQEEQIMNAKLSEIRRLILSNPEMKIIKEDCIPDDVKGLDSTGLDIVLTNLRFQSALFNDSKAKAILKGLNMCVGRFFSVSTEKLNEVTIVDKELVKSFSEAISPFAHYIPSSVTTYLMYFSNVQHVIFNNKLPSDD